MTAQLAEKLERMVNGVAVDKLYSTIDAVKEDPEIARFNFRITNRWVNGGHNRTTVKDFYGANKTHAHETPFVLEADEPALLLGQDQGANPVEHLLNALAACVTSTIVYHAAARGIEIRGVDSRLEGDLDLRGFLGVSNEVPVGYQNIRITFKIDAEAPEKEKELLIEMGKKYSPVYNTLFAGKTSVTVELDKG
ncbi:MAG: OsmC family protein [Deltaproteobacteria bacterium]|nr:OsmC family protein [Deltaproteobacteria bacterium]